MQYTITEKLKRLMYKILVAFLGVMFTCFSGVAQEELSVLADIGYKEKITSALSSKLVEYKNTSVSKDTFLLKQSGERAIDMIAGNDDMLVDSVIINIDVESSWKIGRIKVYVGVSKQIFYTLRHQLRILDWRSIGEHK